MEPSDLPLPPTRSLRTRIVLIALLLLVIGGLAMAYLSQGKGDRKKPEDAPTTTRFEAAFRPRDEAPVIGVSAGGRHRAYLLQALMRPDTHVYNDLLGGVPVTVTFCDLDGCVQVFTKPNRNRPLDIAVDGPDRRRERKMLLRIGPTRYWQDTGLPLDDAAAAFPYAKADFERTTWGQWRDAHPDTDLYAGKLPFTPTDPTFRYAPLPGEKD